MKVVDSVKILILIFLICHTVSCKSTKKTNEIVGTYIFEYPSKEVQLLAIYKDSTFSQKIYVNIESYKKKVNSLYINSGSWALINDGLEFDNWLSYCYLRFPDSIPNKPSYGLMLDVFWYIPNNIHKGLISIDDETGYVFKNIVDVK